MILEHAGKTYDVGDIVWYGNSVPGYVFTFGKYKGLAIEDVIKQDASYVNWALLNVEPLWIGDFTAWLDYYEGLTKKSFKVDILSTEDFGKPKPNEPARPEYERFSEELPQEHEDGDTMWDNPYPEYD